MTSRRTLLRNAVFSALGTIPLSLPPGTAGTLKIAPVIAGNGIVAKDQNQELVLQSFLRQHEPDSFDPKNVRWRLSPCDFFEESDDYPGFEKSGSGLL